MKLKQLESHLGGLEQFSNPKAENTFGDITDKVVLDLGCGCGTLGVAASLIGAQHVIGVDVDSDALEIASLNASELEIDMDIVNSDIRKLNWRGAIVDTVVMNPPFGTRMKGADMDFLSAALKISNGAVYSMHKTSTRDYIKRSSIQDLGAKSAEVLCELRFDLPASYKFHKKREVDIAVDLWRFTT